MKKVLLMQSNGADEQLINTVYDLKMGHNKFRYTIKMIVLYTLCSLGFEWPKYITS